MQDSPDVPAGSRPADTVQRGRERATRLVFLVAGMGMSAWAPLVPFAKQRAGIDETMLGALLLCFGFGSMLAMPVAGAMTARIGCRPVLIVAGLLTAGALALLATLSAPVTIALALVAFGIGIGAMDVAMNVQAVEVERSSGRAMMSGFHGLFSFGGILGAAFITLLLHGGLSTATAALVVSAIMLAALAGSARHLLQDRVAHDGPVFLLPRGSVMSLGILTFIAFLAEGALLDWSAVFLQRDKGVAAESAGIGYTVFAVAMTLGRLTGDRIVTRFGDLRVAVTGAVIAAAGLLMVLYMPSGWHAIAAHAVVGIGCANIVPVLFTACGRQAVMPPGMALAAISTLGYSGILMGPALIGLASHAVGLRGALSVVAVLLVGLAVGVPRVMRHVGIGSNGAGAARGDA